MVVAIRRALLSIRHGRRNYDRNIAGLGMGRAPRYFAFGREGISDRLFGVNMIEALEAVESSSAVLRAVIQYSNAVLELTKANYKKLPELAQPVEKKGKCFRSIAPIICRPRKRFDNS